MENPAISTNLIDGRNGRMQRSKYTEEQIAFTLRPAETGTPASAFCRGIGISEVTFYVWKTHAKLGVSELRRLR